MACDVTSEDDLDTVFYTLAAERDMPLASVIYNAGNNSPIAFEALTPEQFEAYWRVCCLGGFLTAKRAMPLLAQQGNGSMLFTGCVRVSSR
jgi:NAD(P)-dependent dehydrogenase (short-subunit alcohol dehydrogenase family)